MRIAVVGASGMLGVPLVEQLESAGHEVRRLHRGSGTHPVDLGTGEGLASALEGVDVVVNAANQSSPRRAGPVMVEGTRRLLAASSAHHVLVSIVGTEAMASLNGYYRAKLAQERIVRESGAPFSIVASTQFHEFVGGFALALARWRIELHSAGRVQPVSAREAAAVVARVSAGEPTGSTSTLAGPEVLTITQLRAGRGLPLPVPIGGKLGAALKAGVLTRAEPDIGGVLTYAGWLAETRGRPWRPTPR
jgi:uncharacterized protein YbjT (DUF2867 family)